MTVTRACSSRRRWVSSQSGTVLAAAAIDAVDRGAPQRDVGTHFPAGSGKRSGTIAIASSTRNRRASFGRAWQDELDTTALALQALGVPSTDPEPAYLLANLRLERLHPAPAGGGHGGSLPLNSSAPGKGAPRGGTA
jgi:hypothetical protein